MWPWYGSLAQGNVYGAAEFLQVHEYGHVRRWADAIAARPAVQRDAASIAPMGEPALQLAERRDASDFDRKI